MGPLVWIYTSNGGREAGRLVSWDETQLVYTANLKIAPTRRIESGRVIRVEPVTESSLPVALRKI